MNPSLFAAQQALAGGRFEQALHLADRAVAVDPGSGPAQGLRGQALLGLGRHHDAAEALRRAAVLLPSDASIWFQLGVACYDLRALDEAEEAFRRALQGSPRDARVLACLGRVYLLQERLVEAVEVVQQALQASPAQPHPDALLAFGLLSLELRQVEAVAQAVALLEHVGAPAAQVEALRQELQRLRREAAAPVTAPAAPPAAPPAAAPAAARRWGTDEIAILCGHRPRPWSPRTLAQGIGGSEEAVIRLSRELVRLGWKVTVYNDPGAEAGVYEGVTYRPFESLNPADAFNIVIAWRNIRLLDQGLTARRTLLWLHDLPNPDVFTRRRLAALDQIIVLSQFHRSCLPHVPEEKFFISGNGIDPDQFAAASGAPRNPYRCIYTSSYDRGLEVLLGLWADVKRAVPPAELHVFYGWESFAHAAQDPAFQTWRAGMERLMAQPGVFHHGRVSQDRIAAEMLQSGLWTYPATFQETSCITAMKAQAAGAVPVVLDYAALQETVQYGVKIEAAPDGVCPPAKGAAYRDRLIRALRDTAWQESVRAEMTDWARRRFAWETVARQWHEQFTAVRRAA